MVSSYLLIIRVKLLFMYTKIIELIHRFWKYRYLSVFIPYLVS